MTESALPPYIMGVTEVTTFPIKAGPQRVIVLDRIVAGGELPEYCTHGRATCVSCPEWVWLGDRSHQLVLNRHAVPMCRECAIAHVFAAGGQDSMQRLVRVRDHLRKDGLH